MNSKPYEIVIFDVDGTLLDTTEGILAAVSYTIEKAGLKELPPQKLKAFIGPPIQESFAAAYGLEGEILQELATIFRDRYKNVDLLKAQPYEGIYQVMEELGRRGIRQAVATYKRQDYAELLLKHFGFDRYTKLLFGADHENKLKKKDIIALCLKAGGVADPSVALMVGDTAHDAQGASQIGADFLGVSYGFGFRSGADADAYPNIGCAGCPADILRYL